MKIKLILTFLLGVALIIGCKSASWEDGRVDNSPTQLPTFIPSRIPTLTPTQTPSPIPTIPPTPTSTPIVFTNKQEIPSSTEVTFTSQDGKYITVFIEARDGWGYKGTYASERCNFACGLSIQDAYGIEYNVCEIVEGSNWIDVGIHFLRNQATGQIFASYSQYWTINSIQSTP